jgi:iron complex transport system substrate-binding protein
VSRPVLPASRRTADSNRRRGHGASRLLPALGAVLAVGLLASACSSDSSDGSGAGSGSRSGETTSAASSATGPSTTYPLTLDNCGFKVTFAGAPDRVVTIKSTTAEMLLALGLGDHIVGAAYLDGPIPDSLKSAASGNDALSHPLSDKVPGSEAVLAKQPDLVYAGWESNVTKTGAGDRSTLQSLGVNTYVSPSACEEKAYQPDPLTFDDVFSEIDEVGKIFDVQARAALLVAQQQAELAAIKPDSRGLTALWWSSATDVPYVGAGIGAPEMLMKTVGLTNIAADVHATWTPYSWEKVIAADPSVIVLVDASWNTAQHKIDYLESNGATKNLTAVKNHRFLIVPFASTEAGVRNVDAAKDLALQLSKLNLS